MSDRPERVVKLPTGFNPRQHIARLEKKLSDEHGASVAITQIDMTKEVAHYIVAQNVTTVESSGTARKVNLASNVMPSHGAKINAQLMNNNPGFQMVIFDPYRREAVLMELAPHISRARDVLASALGCDPWDIQVKDGPNKSLFVNLHKAFDITKHRDALYKAMWTEIGSQGWTMDISLRDRTVRLTPGEKSEGELRCRNALAVAFGVKEWDLDVKNRPGGGFNVVLPSTFVESRHATKLQEVATTKVGEPGWFYTLDLTHMTAEIIPGELPTFERSYDYPFNAKPTGLFSFPVGMALAGPGEPNRELMFNLEDNAGVLIQGLAGSGKSVTLNCIIYSVLMRGFDLVLINVPHKASDFDWCKPFVRQHGWGCESSGAAVAAVSLAYDEGKRRGEIMREYGVQKWQSLPADVRSANPPIIIIMDELTALLLKEVEPKALPKDHPDRIYALQINMEKDLLMSRTARIPAEMRAAGLRMLLATQQAQSNTGIPPVLKNNLPTRVLLGVGGNKQARGHAFLNPDAVPDVPANIVADGRVSKGVGLAEFEGQPPAVFKSFYASVDDLRSNLKRLGVRTTNSPEPTAEHIAHYVPRLDEEDFPDDGPQASALDFGWGAPDGRDAPDPKLMGAARAAKQLRDEQIAHARSMAKAEEGQS